jgi:glucokinase
MYILAGDIGGTKTLLGLFEAAPRRPAALDVRRYDTRADTSLDALIDEFLHDCGPQAQVSCAVLGVAGPVRDNQAQLTNQPWLIDGLSLERGLRAPVMVLNDVESLAYALDALSSDELVPIRDVPAVPDGPRAVVAVGTGLGEAQLVRAEGRAVACPSEGGHADFAPRTPAEDMLVARLRQRHGRATVEHVLSGPGLVTLHHLTHEGRACAVVTMQAGEADLPAITRAGLDGRCEGCVDTLDMFVSALGSEAGNLALRTLPTGGLFVGGGIPPHMLPLLRTAAFKDAFLDKPPMRPVLDRIPLHVITSREAGLLGAAVAGNRHLR